MMAQVLGFFRTACRRCRSSSGLGCSALLTWSGPRMQRHTPNRAPPAINAPGHVTWTPGKRSNHHTQPTDRISAPSPRKAKWGLLCVPVLGWCLPLGPGSSSSLLSDPEMLLKSSCSCSTSRSKSPSVTGCSCAPDARRLTLYRCQSVLWKMLLVSSNARGLHHRDPRVLCGFSRSRNIYT